MEQISSMKKFILTALSAAILTACGGGSEDNTNVESQTDNSVKITTSNTVPTVTITADKTYPEQSNIILKTKSEDKDNDTLEFKWTQKSGVDVELKDTTSDELSFTAPTTTEEVALSFEVSVSDGNGGKANDTVTISIIPINDLPKVKAGDAQTVNEQTEVTLTGIASDTDGEITLTNWQQTSGTSVELKKVSDNQVSFTAPTITEQTQLTFTFNATDNENATSNDSVIITILPINLAPTAEAGTNVTINPETISSLDASASHDEDGDIAVYAWKQTSGTPVELSFADTVKPSFTAPKNIAGETLTFELTVTDNEQAVATDTIDVYVNKYPTANAGKNQITETGHLVKLDASSSQDDGQIVTYEWVQSLGETVTLVDSDTANPSFNADLIDDEKLTFAVTVTDDMGLSHTDTVEIAVVKVNRFINDTGVIVSVDFDNGNDTQCIASTNKSQDCEQGRDAQANAGTLVKTGSGIAGFDFTKLSTDGSELADDVTEWSCVRDNFTGLIWEVKTNDGGIQDRFESYRWGGKGAFGNNDANRQGTYYNEWNDLVDHLNNSKLCGKSDWTLPTVEELTSIRTHQKNGNQVDAQFFPNNIDVMYWTANPSANSNSRAHFVSFKNSDDGHIGRSTYQRVRLVSGGKVNQESYLVDDHKAERYITLDDGTVTDLETGLMWSRCLLGQSWDQTEQTCTGDSQALNWQQAHELSTQSQLGGHSNWRLPNIKELRTIAAFNKSSKAFNTQIFPNMQFPSIDRIWSSTPAIAGYHSIYALTLTSIAEVDEMRRTTTTPRVILVRNLH